MLGYPECAEQFTGSELSDELNCRSQQGLVQCGPTELALGTYSELTLPISARKSLKSENILHSKKDFLMRTAH